MRVRIVVAPRAACGRGRHRRRVAEASRRRSRHRCARAAGRSDRRRCPRPPWRRSARSTAGSGRWRAATSSCASSSIAQAQARSPTGRVARQLFVDAAAAHARRIGASCAERRACAIGAIDREVRQQLGQQRGAASAGGDRGLRAIERPGRAQASSWRREAAGHDLAPRRLFLRRESRPAGRSARAQAFASERLAAGVVLQRAHLVHEVVAGGAVAAPVAPAASRRAAGSSRRRARRATGRALRQRSRRWRSLRQ